MSLDFNIPMTGYEFIAIVISIVALLLPAIRWGIKKFLIKTKLEIYPTNQLKLLYNESGSYINLDFSIECKYKNAIVQNIETIITRENDGKKLELIQSTFKSPIYSAIGNNYVSSNEAAHPFKIEENGLTNIFLEESIKSAEIVNKLSEIHNNKLQGFKISNNYEEDIKVFESGNQYNNIYAKLYEELFWKKGKYTMQLIIKYNKNKKMEKKYNFEIDEKEAKLFEANVTEALVCRLKNAYNIPTNFYYGSKNYNELN